MAASWRVLDLNSRLGRLLGAYWRRLGAVLAPKKNLAWQWNGKRVFIHMRLHFTDILCIFRTGELYQYIGRWSDSGALDPGGLKKRAVFQYVSFFLLRV